MSRSFAPLFLGGLVSLFVCFPARGQTPHTLSVDEAVRLAVSRNPRLEATILDVRAASSGVRSAQALTNPTVTFTPGITSISGSGEEFLAQQPLEINGTRQARTAVANADLRGARAEALVILRDIIYQTKVAYYALALAQRRAQIARELLSVATEADRIARKQVEEGARAGVDLAQTGIEVARAEREVTLADGTVIEATVALNTLLARPTTEPIPALELADQGIPGTISGGSALLPEASGANTTPQAVRPQNGVPTSLPPGTPPTVSDSGDPLFVQAYATRGETQSAIALRDRYRAEAALARAEGRPDIAPQVRVGYFTRGLQPASDGSGAGIGVSLTMPLFDYGSRKNRIRQAEDSTRAQESRITATQNDIRQEIVQAQARVAAAETVLASYRGGVMERAKRLLDASQLGFREGRVSVIALLEAQRSYIGVQNEYAEALAGVASARAAVERASGTIPETLLPAPKP